MTMMMTVAAAVTVAVTVAVELPVFRVTDINIMLAGE